MTDTLFGSIKDHPIADLLRRPTVLEVFDHSAAQFRMPDQLALC